MNDAEWLALAGLVRLVMHSDGVISRKEHRFVAELAKRLGPKMWQMMAEAEVHLKDEAHVRQQASRVVRPEARAQIREILAELAAHDGVAPEERAILDWLDELWSSPPPA